MTMNALYTTLRRRGTTRQLAGAIVTCAVSALLLLLALLWFNLRFNTAPGTLPVAEVEVALVYVALWGWLLPLSITTAFCLFTPPRTTTASIPVPGQKRPRTTRLNEATALKAPHRQPGIPVPHVYSNDAPWGWLEYRGGNFKGQRLALKLAIVSIGRGEDNDIWLDDDLASRHHAELAWDNGTIYITDCDSMNGVLLNGKRIRNCAAVQPGDLLEIGSQRFQFALAQPSATTTEQDDPLSRHVWHSADSNIYTATKPLEDKEDRENREDSNRADSPPALSVLSAQASFSEQLRITPPRQPNVKVPLPNTLPGQTPSELWQNSQHFQDSQDTAELDHVQKHPPVTTTGAFIIRDGALTGQSFLLDRPTITIGRGIESDIIINDVSISRRHAQVSRQANGNFVQDLASRNGSTVNGEPLLAPHLLQPGDVLCLGNIRLEYFPVQAARTTPIPMVITPPLPPRLLSGPTPLRLPSRPKETP